MTISSKQKKGICVAVFTARKIREIEESGLGLENRKKFTIICQAESFRY
jgi:hypothetical protein